MTCGELWSVNMADQALSQFISLT